MVELYDYDGILFFERLTDDQMQQITVIDNQLKRLRRMSDTSLEIRYQGRDAGNTLISPGQRGTVGWLKHIAPILGNARGKITCTYSDDEKSNDIPPEGEDRETRFEYYSIRDGKLWMQPSKLVRGEMKEVG